MLRKLRNRIKGQSTAEYAILIALVVAAVIAMQTYAKRALQARIRDASVYLTNQSIGNQTTVQYEPYYLQTDFNVVRVQDSNMIVLANKELGGTSTQAVTTVNRVGSQTFGGNTATIIINVNTGL